MIDNKPRSKIILDELKAKTNEGNEVPIQVTQVSPPLVVSTQEPRVSHHSGRVVTQPEHFIGLGEVLKDLEIDPNKLEAMSDVCLFVGYSKGTKGYLFYDPKLQRVLVSTNVRFLEEDYMIDK